MKVVRLKEFGAGGHALKQKIHVGRLSGLGYFAECFMELERVSTKIWWQALTDNKYFGLGFERRVGHCHEIVVHRADGQAAQAVIAAQCDDDDGRGMFRQRGIDARNSATRCFSRDAGIDDAIIQLLLVQPRFQQGGPGGIGANAIAGRE